MSFQNVKTRWILLLSPIKRVMVEYKPLLVKISSRIALQTNKPRWTMNTYVISKFCSYLLASYCCWNLCMFNQVCTNEICFYVWPHGIYYSLSRWHLQHILWSNFQVHCHILGLQIIIEIETRKHPNLVDIPNMNSIVQHLAFEINGQHIWVVHWNLDFGLLSFVIEDLFIVEMLANTSCRDKFFKLSPFFPSLFF